MSGETSQPPIDYYVLRNGETAGPFTVEQLAAEFSAGRIEAGDFVQAVGDPNWHPLAHVLDVPGAELPEAIAPDWACILKWAGLRLRDHIAEHTLIVGAVCVGLGTLALALSHWPFVFWIPWLLAAAALGLVLIRGKRHAHGALLLGGALALPLLLVFFWPKARLKQAEPVEAPVRVAENAPAVSPATPAPTPIPALPLPTALPPVAEPVAEAAPAPPAAVATPEPAPAIIPGVAVATSAAPAPPAAPAIPEPVASAPTTSPLRSAGEFITASSTKLTDEVKSLFASFSKHSITGGSPTSDEEWTRQYADAFVIVKGSNGSGSGFVCRTGNQTRLYTNIHVVAEIKDAEVTRLDGVAIIPGPAEIASGADVARFTMPNPPARPLEMLTDFDANVRIGDDVVVLGNSGGGGVVTALHGKVLGLGPDRVEVSAEFIPGNSGSPIIHVPTGKVIGIATYLTRRYEEFSSNPSGSQSPHSAGGSVVVRRFGYRIDRIPVWQAVNWPEFYAEAGEMSKVSELTQDILNFFVALRSHAQPRFATDALRHPAEDWMNQRQNPRLNGTNHQAASENFLNALRFLVRGDVAAADARIRYAYFRDELSKERQVRDRLYKSFDAQAANFSSALNRSAY